MAIRVCRAAIAAGLPPAGVHILRISATRRYRRSSNVPRLMEMADTLAELRAREQLFD